MSVWDDEDLELVLRPQDLPLVVGHHPGRDDVGDAGLHVALDGSPPLLQWPRLEEHITFQ